jgi:hypothetical protein
MHCYSVLDVVGNYAHNRIDKADCEDVQGAGHRCLTGLGVSCQVTPHHGVLTSCREWPIGRYEDLGRSKNGRVRAS